MTTRPPAVAAAFFDVDGTLTTTTTMFRFLRYWLNCSGRPPQRYQQVRGRLREMAEAGVPREITNRVYFDSYTGGHAGAIARSARSWFAAELACGGLFNPHAIAALQAHRDAGALIVLVSGSFRDCLAPLAAHLGADAALCTEPEVVDGRYSGRVATPLIGDAKADRVRRFAVARGIDLGASIAYGDHDSDLPLLRVAGRAVVVGEDPTMLRHAAANGWGTLPGAPAPGPLPGIAVRDVPPAKEPVP